MTNAPPQTRRRKYPSPEMVSVQSRVTPEISQLLSTVAISEGRSVSAQVAIILEQWLNDNYE